MSKMIRLESIRIRSLTNPHDDLPADMQMLGHLILDGNIFLQTLPVGSEESQNSWKLDFGCKIPSHAPTFSVAILRLNKDGNIRLLGSVEIGKGEVINAVETNKRVVRLQLNKVNPDGPSLEFSAGFTVSDAPPAELSGFSLIDTPNNLSETSGRHVVLLSELSTVTSLQSPRIADDLQRMLDAINGQVIVDPLYLGVMHERILLLPYHHHNDRARFHNRLGEVALRCYGTSGSVDSLNLAISAYDDAVRDNPGSAIYLSDLGDALVQRFERLGDLTDIRRAVPALEASVSLPLDANTDAALLFDRFGVALRCRFDCLTNPEDIQRSVSMCEAAVGLTENHSQIYPGLLNNLGISLLRRFDSLGDLTDLNEGVSKLATVAEMTSDGHPHMLSCLNNLGSGLFQRFKRLGDLADLNKAVSQFETAVGLMPDHHPNAALCLRHLGNSLLSRFKHLGDVIDLNEAVSKFEAAVRLTPNHHPEAASRLNSLGEALLSRFERFGDLSDINEAVSKFEASLKLTPDGHPAMHISNNLGNALLARFERLGDLTDINEVVSKYEAALELASDGHRDKPALLNNLGNSLLSRFARWGDLADITRAVPMLEAAVDLTPRGHPKIPSRLDNLGRALCYRFERFGQLIDINEAMSKFEAALELTPDGHPDTPFWLKNLGNSLLRRFTHLGDLADINEAVAKFEAAVKLTPDGHPTMASRLNNLGDSLLRRFECFGDLSDINQAVSKFEAAVELTPDGHPDKHSWLNNLGNSLLLRFGRSGDLTDITKAVSKFGTAVELTPDGHPRESARLNNLGHSLMLRSEYTGDLSDITQAVLKHRAALKLMPDDHPSMPSRLNNLGISLLSRFERSADLNDINEAVSKLEAAVELTQDGHPDKPSLLNNLGLSLQHRFIRLHDPHDYHQMLVQFTRAACSPTGFAHIRFQAATLWASTAKITQHPSLLEAYTTAINLLPQLAWLGLSINDRHHHIRQAGTVVRDAATAAIAENQLSTAVEWLEQGRSIIWGQILNLRTPVDDLRKSHPDIADKLVSYSTRLEAAGTKSSTLPERETGPSQSPQAVAQDSHALADKRDKLLKQIRTLAGFERFLLPKPISELSLAAALGPVVLLNITEHRCDALILMPGLQDEVMHVTLPDFTLQDARTMTESLGSLVRGAARNERLEGHQEGALPVNEQFSQILSALWIRIVKPISDGIACSTPPNQDLGRIWWCPTGPLAFLPIHAAGLYGEDNGFGSKLSDFFISSYTPSLTALIEGVRARDESEERLQILAVAQPFAIGQSSIPGTLREIASIGCFTTIPVLHLEQHLATVDSVQDGMRKSRWAHFACHGVQHVSDPTNSALLLAESSRLTLSSIIQLSLPANDLAFLSACQTATGSRSLEDESVHLTAGMLLAGYRGVIGTMWSIMDHDAPKVAGDVYAHLFQTSPPDATRAAEALHLAVEKLRDSDKADGTKSFYRWVPFIHVGV